MSFPTIHDYEKLGEKLLESRPKPLTSLANLLKDFFFNEALFMKGARLTTREVMKFWSPDPKDRFELNLWSCIDNEERFWFSMCLLKYNASSNPMNSLEFEEVYIDVVSNNAEKFNALKEASKLLLNFSSDRLTGADNSRLMPMPKGYKMKKVEDKWKEK